MWRMTLTLHSPASEPGPPIPARFDHERGDLSPALAWDGVPESTAGLVLLVDDPDARSRLPLRDLPAPARSAGPDPQSTVSAVRGAADRAYKDGSACRLTRCRKRPFKKLAAGSGLLCPGGHTGEFLFAMTCITRAPAALLTLDDSERAPTWKQHVRCPDRLDRRHIGGPAGRGLVVRADSAVAAQTGPGSPGSTRNWRNCAAREIPHAELLPLEGVGHQMPPRAWWTSVIAAMLRHTSGG